MILSWEIPEYRPSNGSQIREENTAPSIPLLIGFRVLVPYKRHENLDERRGRTVESKSFWTAKRKNKERTVGRLGFQKRQRKEKGRGDKEIGTAGDDG